MKIVGITYADVNMYQSRELCAKSILKHGAHIVMQYNRSAIDVSFLLDNRNILGQKRGGGYWLWKAYVIYKAINCIGVDTEYDLEDGDILIYSDAGVEFVESVHHIINRMDEDIFFFTNGFPHVEWCKGDVIKAINPDHYKVYIEPQLDIARDIKQVQASVIFFKVNQKTRDFVKEWLLWCQMPSLIDDSPSIAENYKTFAEHRHDQAILSSLRIKYGYKMHFWPTAYSEHIRHTAQPEDNYPILFNHHRKRDPGKGDGVNPEW